VANLRRFIRLYKVCRALTAFAAVMCVCALEDFGLWSLITPGTQLEAPT
jgi:hypothetical protein